MANFEIPSLRSKKRSKKMSSNAASSMEPTDYLTLRKNPHWMGIVGCIQPLFREPYLTPKDLDPTDVCRRINLLQKGKENQSKLQMVLQEEIKRFMVGMRDGLKNLNGPELLNKVARIWQPFYSVTIPCMTALFIHFETRIPVHKIILSSFRDVVLFKIKFRDSLADARKEIREAEFPDRSLIPNEISHMLLILQMEVDFYPELQEMLIFAMDNKYEPLWKPIAIKEEPCDPNEV